MFITSRCNQAGPLGKYIPTRSFAAFLFARLPGRTVRNALVTGTAAASANRRGAAARGLTGAARND